tara:strand:- start:1628 stop:1762 length:135 start_codon:yes stop_codon:yes gene_type:complete
VNSEKSGREGEGEERMMGEKGDEGMSGRGRGRAGAQEKWRGEEG